MTALPAATDYTGSSVTQGGKKTFMTSLRAFLSECLGSSGGTITLTGTTMYTGISGSGTGGNYRCISDDGNSRWLVGLLNSASATALNFYDLFAGASRMNISSAGHILAGQDNTNNLGSASFRFKEVFSALGTINTSDARDKTPVRPMNDAELKAAKLIAREFGMFQFLDAVAEKGIGARLHAGTTVQRVIEIMTSCGLDPAVYSFICYDKWDKETLDWPEVKHKPAVPAVQDEHGNVIEPPQPEIKAQPARVEVLCEAGDKYSFRVTELLLFIARGFEARLAALEAGV